MRREPRARPVKAEGAGRPDRLRSVLSVVVLTTVIGVAIGVTAGVSELTTGIILVWGVVLAVMVASVRDSD